MLFTEVLLFVSIILKIISEYTVSYYLKYIAYIRVCVPIGLYITLMSMPGYIYS